MAGESWGARGRWIARCALVSAPLAWTAWSAPSVAQVNLPPPPPPPLSTNQPPAAPPPSRPPPSSSPPARPPPRSQPASSPPARSTRPAQYSPPPSYDPPPAWSRRDLSLRLNPLPLVAARISADVEILVASHHALVFAPNVTLATHRGELVSQGFGFTNDRSTGFGAEAGYHYWFRRDLEGLYLGPSLVFGSTSTPNAKTFGYFGGAFDVGYQLVIGSGFTLLGGGGLLLIDANSTTKATPRGLLGIGWTF